MKINYKFFLLSSIILGFLLSGAFFLAFPIQGSKPNLSHNQSFPFEKELLLLDENTLFSLASPFNPETSVKNLNVVVTAYSSTPWETWGDPFITAAGTHVKDGIVANNYLPFGTRVRIPEIYGERVFVVEDRMHSRKGYYHVDIWFPSYSEALNFGVKKTYIEVLEN